MNYSQVNAFADFTSGTSLAPGAAKNEMIINTPGGAQYKVIVGDGASAMADATKVLQKTVAALPNCQATAAAAAVFNNPAVVANPSAPAADAVAAAMASNTEAMETMKMRLEKDVADSEKLKADLDEKEKQLKNEQEKL